MWLPERSNHIGLPLRCLSFFQNPIAFARTAIQVHFKFLTVCCLYDKAVAMPTMHPFTRMIGVRRRVPILPRFDDLSHLVFFATPGKCFRCSCYLFALHRDRFVDKFVHSSPREKPSGSRRPGRFFQSTCSLLFSYLPQPVVGAESCQPWSWEASHETR